MNSGLYVSPGCSATACAAATARRFAEPVTKFSKRCRASTCIATLSASRARAEALQHELRDAAEGFEDARTMQGVAGEIGHAAEVDRVLQLVGGEDQVLGEVLLVVLDHQRDGARIHGLLGEI